MSRTVQAIDWSGSFTDLVTQVLNFIPKLLVFAGVLFIGWLVAKAVSRAVKAILERIGFQQVLDRSGLGRFFTGSFGPIDLISRLLYYFILLIALQLALTAFGPTNPVSRIVDDIVAWLPQAVVAVVIVIVVAAIANAVRELLVGALGGLSYAPLLSKIVYGFILALGAIAALNQVGIGLSVTMPVLIAALATASGILIVGVGGGLVSPMRERWAGWLDSLESEVSAQRATAPSGGDTSTQPPSSSQD